METQQKPRISYTQFMETMPVKQTFAEGTVAALIGKYIEEKSQPGRRQMGPSQTYTLRRLQRTTLGGIKAAALKPTDYIEYCASRIAAGRKPATARQDMTFLVIVLKHAEDIWEVPGVNLKVWKKARRQLEREQLIGKSTPRTRLPEDEEIAKCREGVAPRAGAWIETTRSRRLITTVQGRAPRGRVD